MPLTSAEPITRHFIAQLGGSSRVDPNAGMIMSATVAKAGVPALGKFVFLDAAGKITRDPKMGVKRIPVFTDGKTLDTLLASAQDAGLKVKCREDHDDTIGARIGFVNNFKRTAPDTVSADIHVFKNYPRGALLFETAAMTPEMIGLSIDPGQLIFDLGEIDGQKVALMRVVQLEAVDVVDAGAITPEGLLFNNTTQIGVDTGNTIETPPPSSNPEPQSTKPMVAPTLEDVMNSIKEVTTGYAALAAQVKACSEAVAAHGETLAKLTSAKPPPAADPADSPAVMAKITELSDQLKATTASLAQMKRERALLGFRGTPAEKAAVASQTAEEIEKMAAGKKDYLTMVEETAAADKCSKFAAHLKVQKSPDGKVAYRDHLRTRGVFDSDRMAKAS